MVNIKLESDGFLLENKVLFGPIEHNPKYINLALDMGEDVVNQKLDYSFINFPGEYDIDGIGFKVFAGKDKRLNYLVTLKQKKYGFIQSPKILEEDEISDMDYRMYTDEKVENKIDQLELEGKKLKLNHNIGLEVDMKDDQNHEEIDIKVSNTNGEAPEVEIE